MSLLQTVSAGTSQYTESTFQLLIQLESQGQECRQFHVLTDS